MAHVKSTPILEGRRSQPHQLIEVLQDVQEHYGDIAENGVSILPSIRF